MFRAGADATSVHVAVRQRNQPVPGLAAADFELLDNGVAQTISAVTAGEVPIDVTLVLDASASVASHAPQIRADVERIGQRLGRDDRVRVLSFASNVREALAWRSLASPAEPIRLADAGATAFYHALVAALLPPAEAGRPHLVVAMSDGQDNLSLIDGRDVLELARRSDAVLHVVLRRSYFQIGTGWLPFSGPGDRKFVKQAAEETGGRLTEIDAPGWSPVSATTAKPDDTVVRQLTRVIDEFRSSYVLWFKPAGVMLPGWHELTVRVKRGNPTVTHRKGYFGR